jgi:nucleoside-diphosphate-sugar epimerase
VDALLLLEERASSPPVTVNIGSGEPTRLGSLAQKVVALSGKDIKVSYDLSRPVGPLSRTADIARASALLGWRPRTSLDEGLRRTYSWVRLRLAPSS